MDDTSQSRTSDVAANAATRKRRSSILKSQRPPRTPFCDLEFNVCTPTDTSKSRRVSFSKRTGVAEFVTNEATTTWKNFYEEQNKSLESSGNESAVNHGKQPVAHLGKRIFDQQFEEVEAVDFMGTVNPGINITSSINSINFAQLECTETKLTGPQGNFELSAMTETQSRLFGDNLGITCAGETSARIDVNFSTIDQIGEKDDLDEIQKDLQRQSNIVCPGPFAGQNISEYIEIDLNMTHVAIPNDESNMSITDTISSPKVQDVSKSCSIDKKISIGNKDWVADKENIVLNPYVAPRESLNFAVTEIPDEVLVFDGKRLIVETDNSKKENRQSVLHKPAERAPQRKTIVLNCNDDLPNFFEDAQTSRNQSSLASYSIMQQSRVLEHKPARHRLNDTQNTHKTIIFGDDLDNISVTQAVPNIISNVVQQQTTVYNDESGNISITQALASNIVEKEKRRTIVFQNDNADISVTQAVPANVIIPNSNTNDDTKTIVFENESCNISLTQAIPVNIVFGNNDEKPQTIGLENVITNISSSNLTRSFSQESRKTLVYESSTGSTSITPCNSKEKVQNERRTTVMFEREMSNISVTQAVPSNIILLPQKLNVTNQGSDSNISVTQALPANIILGNNTEPNRRRTVVCKDDAGNLSITQAVTKNQVIEAFNQPHITQLSDIELATNSALHLNNVSSFNVRPVFESKDVPDSQPNTNIETTGNKRQTIIFQNDAADISITQAVPIGQVIQNIITQNQTYPSANIDACHEALSEESSTNKRRTIVFENVDADISLTQAVPINQIINAVNMQNQNNCDIKDSQEVQSNIDIIRVNQVMETVQNNTIKANNIDDKESSNKRRTILFSNNDGDISLTQAIPTHRVIDAIQNESINIEATKSALHQGSTNKRRTVVFDNENADISITQAVPMSKLMETLQKEKQDVETADVTLCQELNNSRKTLVFENVDADISMTQVVPISKIVETIKKENLNIEANDANLHGNLNDEGKTVVFENENVNISITQAISVNKVIETIQKDSHNIEATDVTLHQELNDKRSTVVFENENADMSVTQYIPINQVIETVQKNNNNGKDVTLFKEDMNIERKSIVVRNVESDMSVSLELSKNQAIDTTQKESPIIDAVLDKETTNETTTAIFKNENADVSMTLAIPLNQVIDIIKKDDNTEVTKSDLRKTINNDKSLVVSDNADIFTAEAVSLTQVINKQKNELNLNVTQNENKTIMLEPLSYDNDTCNKMPHIVYDDDEGDISNTRAISSNIILPNGQEKKRTIVVESVESLLENKDLFMEIDRLTDATNENTNSEHIYRDKDYDISMTDLSDIEISGKKALIYDDVFCGQKSIGEDVSRVTKIEEQPASLSKPIPATMATFQQEMIDTSLCKDLTKNDGLKPSNVLVYQSTTDNTPQNIKNEIGDQQMLKSVNEEKFVSEEKKVSSQSLTVIESEGKTPKQDDMNTCEIPNESNNVALLPETASQHSIVNQDNSILTQLLEMSQSSLEGTEDKNISAQICYETPSNVNPAGTEDSSDDLFYIIKDSDDDQQEVYKSDSTSTDLTSNQKMKEVQGESPLSIEYKGDVEPPIVQEVNNKLSIVKEVLQENQVSQSQIRKPKNLDEDTDSKVSLDISRRNPNKSFKMANDTKELLEMLSDFTDKRLSRNLPSDDLKTGNDFVKERIDALENKVEPSNPEPPRFNLTLRRQSVALSREDLLNNLSMATSVLQKSRCDFDESVSIDDGKDTPNLSIEHKRSVKLSTDIVKTLHFDDESMTEKTEPIPTPLKKTTFGEVSYMKDASRVIPEYMTVSDGIKELMDDLVKPVSKEQPFTSNVPESILKKTLSTCSTQIQANLLNTSQIDLHTDLNSTTNSVSELNKISSSDIINDAVHRSMLRALRSPSKSTPVYSQSNRSSDMELTSEDIIDKSATISVVTKPGSSSRPIGEVLIFDQNNPLNNVLLLSPAPHDIDVHRYDPIRPPEVNTDPKTSNSVRGTEFQEHRVTEHFRVELTKKPTHATNRSSPNKTGTLTVTSNTSKRSSIDQSTEPDCTKVKDMEINTMIAMKANEELLQVSSSLTLVECGTNRNYSLFPGSSRRDSASSPVKVIYTVKDPPFSNIETDFTSTDDINKPVKPKKRIYSPQVKDKHRDCTLSSLDLTPKPKSKMQKRSISPDEESTVLPAERDPVAKSPESPKRSQHRSPPRRTKSKRPGSSLTVQRLMTTVAMAPDRDPAHDGVESSTSEPRSACGSRDVLDPATSSDVVSSFTSSNNLREGSLGRSSLASAATAADWAPTASHSLIYEPDAGDDILARINAMPFMGSSECRLESAAGCEWRLLLLNERLRLTLRFSCEPRHPDAPLLAVRLDALHQDTKNPIAYLCVQFCEEMMQHFVARGCGAARDVPRLVRRLGGCARLAAQWARVMYAARLRLAYSLAHDGHLALKVANSSLRTVFEVTMRLQMSRGAGSAMAGGAPWPCAGDVRVTRVLPAPAALDVSRALAGTPHDWGHAPNTIWKVFRFLKHKKRDDDDDDDALWTF